VNVTGFYRGLAQISRQIPGYISGMVGGQLNTDNELII